jgi:hypothetical protein
MLAQPLLLEPRKDRVAERDDLGSGGANVWNGIR